MAQPRVTKQWLQKQFQSSGIQIEPAALTKLVGVVEEVDDPEQFLHELLDEIETNSDERKVTTFLLENVLSQFEGRGGARDAMEVISAFKAPLCLYDPIRKLFHHSTQPRKIFADALSKTQLYVDRFLLIQQRLRRHSLFRPVQWGQLGANRPTRDVAELTELKALLGVVGERRYVTGFLTRQDEGRYFIEDLSARLPLDLTQAETADGIFTENCIVVAEGELTPGGAFRALAVGLPPAEPRVESLAALQGLDFFGGRNPSKAQQTPEEKGRWEANYSEDRVVILSDVHLDRPEVLDNLHTVFRGFSAMEPPPSAFVLMGNFQSYDANAASVNFGRIRDNFATLGRIIRQYTSLLQHSKFLLVPGPGDVGPGDILPRPPLPKAVAAPLLDAVPSAELCSNPCRIRHGPAELVLFRNNLQRKMRGLSILPPPQAPSPDEDEDHDDGGDGSSPMFDHVCATVLQESHLCPVPLEYQPVAWEWDHSLWVYPLPHGLVLADAEPAARYTFDTCACLNPGSLLQGTFGAWKPTENEMEMCDVAGGEGEEEEDDEEEVEAEESELEGSAVIGIDVEDERGEEVVEAAEEEEDADEAIDDAELVEMGDLPQRCLKKSPLKPIIFFFAEIEESGCDLSPLEGYNLGLAIASIFIIFAASFAGAILPASLSFSSHALLVKSVKTLAYAGAGVLLATGFMHLLLPAQEALTSECLSESFLNSYPSYAFLLCVISIACMQVLDYFITVKVAKRAPPSLAGAEELNEREEATAAAAAMDGTTKDGSSEEDAEAGACVVHTVCKDNDCTGHTLLSNNPTTLKAQISAVFLSEASISVHSVLIGLALGITTGDEIVPLLIALTFHQFLEGVAIGTAAVYAGMKTRTVAILALVFALTTPVGIAIGIGVRYSFNENNPTALYTQGVLDAICAGLLIFLALGDHVNAMKSQAHWLKEEGAATHGACIGAFLVGVAVMCALAVWV